jgi:hypothetical protein
MAREGKLKAKFGNLLNPDSFEAILDEATSTVIDDIEVEVDIITFCEHPYYLNQALHSVERFVLKVYYGLPLDNEKKDILIRSYPFDETGKYFTEVEYANFLIAQGRSNLLDPFDFKSSIELVLACGRRSGKTFLASVITAYEAYKLIIKVDPQRYYKLPQGEEIRIINVASTGDQALILAKAAQNRILNSKWFIPYIESKTQSEIRLRTKRDLELLKYEIRNHGKPIDAHASIRIEAMSCTARGIRGGTVIVGILDEIAHFVDNDGNRSGDVIYEALTPSVATFGLDGKILCVSSPWAKNGVFYDLYLRSKGTKEEAGDQNKRMFQIPTWEMNDTITFAYLDTEKRRNPETFLTEFGAEYSSIVTGFFKYPEKIDEAIKREDETSMPKEGNFIHYIAVDPAASHNGYTLAMVHVELKDIIKKENNREIKTKAPVVVLDKWVVWNIKDPEFEGMDYIDTDVIEGYIMGLFATFRVGKIVFDQFDSTSIVNKLKKAGKVAEKTSFTRAYNMKIYSKLRSLFYENQIEIFKHEKGIAELKNLEEYKLGKREFKVEAPKQGQITTDDLADVLANACYVALKTEVEHTVASIIGTNGSQSFKSTSNFSHTSSFHAYRRRLQEQRIVTNTQKAYKLGLNRKGTFV